MIVLTEADGPVIDSDPAFFERRSSNGPSGSASVSGFGRSFSSASNSFHPPTSTLAGQGGIDVDIDVDGERPQAPFFYQQDSPLAHEANGPSPAAELSVNDRNPLRPSSFLYGSSGGLGSSSGLEINEEVSRSIGSTNGGGGGVGGWPPWGRENRPEGAGGYAHGDGNGDGAPANAYSSSSGDGSGRSSSSTSGGGRFGHGFGHGGGPAEEGGGRRRTAGGGGGDSGAYARLEGNDQHLRPPEDDAVGGYDQSFRPSGSGAAVGTAAGAAADAAAGGMRQVAALLQDGRSTWKHLVALYLLAFVAFVMGCATSRAADEAALGAARAQADASAASAAVTAAAAAAAGADVCSVGAGDVLWGDPVYHLEDGGRAYQVVGSAQYAGFTWKEAALDAGTRCFAGKQGKLAAVSDAAANDLLHRHLFTAYQEMEEKQAAAAENGEGGGSPAGDAGGGSEAKAGQGDEYDEPTAMGGVSAWVGGIETSSAAATAASAATAAAAAEYSWVAFVYGRGLASGTPFWRGGPAYDSETGDGDGGGTGGSGGASVDGAYANWMLGEPVSSVAAEAAGVGSTHGGGQRGCVWMDGVTGFWATGSCVEPRPYFVVEFAS